MSRSRTTRPSSDMDAFKELLAKAQSIVIITGAGISAESGISTYRGAGGLWRTCKAKELAAAKAFNRDPSLVWEFHHHRREVVLSKSPNPAHYALAEYERKAKAEGRRFVIATQNIDELHKTAGSENILELHGSLFKVRCTSCGAVTVNRTTPNLPSSRGSRGPRPVGQDRENPRERSAPLRDLFRSAATACRLVRRGFG